MIKCGWLSLLAFALPSVASAQLSAQDKALADAFFNDGVKLLRAGKTADACPKLAESERIDPAVGTALYLGDCYVRLDKIASAQAMFQEAYDYAVRRGDGRAAVAKERRDKLHPSTLTMAVADGALTPGLTITRDDVSVSTLQLGVALPIDGGTHVISARAPARRGFSATVEVPNQEGTLTVSIPRLADEETRSVATVQPTLPTRSSSTLRLVGLATAGVGMLTLAVGVTSGIIATLDWTASNSADNGCNSGTTLCMTQHGIDLRSSAASWATVSTVTLVAGGVLAVAGAVMYFVAPRTKSTLGYISPYISPFVGSQSAGLVVAGRF